MVKCHPTSHPTHPNPHPLSVPSNTVSLTVSLLLSVHAYFLVLGLVIINSKSADLIWLPRDQLYRGYKIHRDSIKFWTCTVILTLKKIKLLHKTFQLMMMYYLTKCSKEKISSSVDMVETVILDYMNIHSVTVTLNLKTENKSSCMMLWPMMIHHHNKFGYKRFSSWGDIVQINICLFCDLDLDHNRAIQSFHKTIQLMMVCHQTKFSCKMISSSAIRKSYFDYIILHCDLDLEGSKPIFLEDRLSQYDASPYQVW